MAKVKKNGAAHTSRSQLPYHLMLAPGMLFLLLFHIVPMGGLIMAFAGDAGSHCVRTAFK